jgi:hypothetical protein
MGYGARSVVADQLVFSVSLPRFRICPVLPVRFGSLLLPEHDLQVTPEPGHPLSDLHYLDGPMNKILSKSSFLADLIEAYSVLTARLRAVVQETTDNSWQLLMAPVPTPAKAPRSIRRYCHS